MQSRCTCLHRLAADAFSLFNVSVSIFLHRCQLNGIKKPLKLMFHKFLLVPFFCSVVGWAHMLEKVGSDCCRFCLGRVSPFLHDCEVKDSLLSLLFLSALLNMSGFYDFLCYNVIIRNNYCIFTFFKNPYLYFSWR